MEQERVREKEPETQGESHYEEGLRLHAEANERSRSGRIVIRAKDLPWRQNRMGYTKRYLSWHGVSETAAADWVCFIHDIKVHSGKHRHQGGIMLFVLDGQGYTLVDGEKVEWEKGDLIILPVKPRGCQHQHFNKFPGVPAK